MAEQLDMNEIINSGVLELYVAGSLSDEEGRKIHQLVKANPELQEEVMQIERAFMQASSSHVVKKPQVNTVYQVLNQIETEKKAEGQEGGQVIDFLKKQEKNDLRWLQIAAAIALILSFAVNLFLYFRVEGLNKDIVALNKDLSTSQQSLQKVLTKNQEQTDFIAVLNETTSQRVPLAKTESEFLQEPFKVSVMYDPESRQIALSQWQLQELKDDEVYQLWAIYEDEVVSLGVLPADSNKIVFKDLEKDLIPTAFAISFEPNGENPTPTEVILVGSA